MCGGGSPGSTAPPGGREGDGWPGISGLPGFAGGPGGAGGQGGLGGAGGSGGTGGAGSGGTIKLEATHLHTPGLSAPTVDTHGGNHTEATQGRFILSQSTADTAAFTIHGANVERFNGPRIANPYIQPLTTDTGPLAHQTNLRNFPA
ncbi:hypothetical protein ACERK3_12775 [Phycisphaerales bacterium AB-hyl4]|uniref:Uncharacterized protein n=1 Tax=Natronomicrosphaera hydrolytica TaxID=3242702 RepID=A0ABV4U6D3_9BACT